MKSRFRFSWLATGISILAVLPLASQTDTALPPALVEKIEAVISAEMARQNITGLSIALARDGQIVYAKGFGLADVENSVPAKATTVYRTGSVAKPITATAVMQLAERGQLDLDAPLQQYCPAFPEKRWPVTTRQLLGHLGGVRHYKSREEFNSTRHFQTLTEGLEFFKNDPLLHEPGTKFSYTTFGYVLLGCVIEGASGMTYLEFVRKNIFEPVGMVRTGADDAYAIIPNRARGYRRTDSGELRNARLADTSYKVPGGGLLSTPVDLVKFALALQAGTLLKKQTLEQMWMTQKTRDGKDTGFGLGWGFDEFGDSTMVAHGGSQQGTRAYLGLLPAEGLAVAAMANLEQVSFDSLVGQIGGFLLEEQTQSAPQH